MTMPLVSVLTPSFNQARWLPDNIRSVASQSYPNIEHIVMDGASTDGSLEVLQTAGTLVTWRSERDRGQSHALNKAFAASHGEFIGWLNSDDAYVDRRAVAKAVDIFTRYPEVGVVYGHGLLVNGANRVLQYLWAPSFNRDLFKLGTFFVQPSVFIRRSIITEPFVDERLHYLMDRDLWWHLLDRTRFRRVDVVVGLDRHQLDRKTLQSGYIEERWRYETGHGIDSNSRYRLYLARTVAIAVRFRGIAGVASLSTTIDPAVSLKFDDLWVRVVRQAAVARRSMPLN